MGRGALDAAQRPVPLHVFAKISAPAKTDLARAFARGGGIASTGVALLTSIFRSIAALVLQARKCAVFTNQTSTKLRRRSGFRNVRRLLSLRRSRLPRENVDYKI